MTKIYLFELNAPIKNITNGKSWAFSKIKLIIKYSYYVVHVSNKNARKHMINNTQLQFLDHTISLKGKWFITEHIIKC